MRFMKFSMDLIKKNATLKKLSHLSVELLLYMFCIDPAASYSMCHQSNIILSLHSVPLCRHLSMVP